MFSSRVRFYFCHFCLPLYFLGRANYIIFIELVLNLMTLGRLPLGDTTVGITGKAGQADKNLHWDAAAKWHDIQDWVNWHADKGTEVRVPWDNGKYKYFVSRGEKSLDHHGEVFQMALRIKSPNDYMTDSPQTSNPVDLSVIKSKYPIVGINSTILPSNVGSNYLGNAGQAQQTIASRIDLKPEENPRNKLKPRDNLTSMPLPPPPGVLDRSTGYGGVYAKGGSRSDRDDCRYRGCGSGGGVGGVNLGGAGQTLEGIGLLDGVSQDANGNLVLIGKSGDDIKLLPLRLDDVVTVFRSVYLNGEGPTVTIDPNPENPTGLAMIIRHSEATDRTYVGWVLYQADRLMKGYTIGKDNLTKRDVTTKITDYAKVLDTMFFGGVQTGNAKQDGSWERFWIVPAEARRFATATDALTLFDVPLKVRTQPMKWAQGKLVDDPNRPPSPGAATFTDWFTHNYDGISQEQYLTPPKESGITQPVPVFTELRRIALLTAIAEKLRDQGIPMPFWMRDYTVRPVPFEKTTPALEIVRSKERITARIFGGVNLSPAETDVKTFTQTPELAQLPKEQQAAAKVTLDQAASLAPVVQKAMAGAEPLQVRAIDQPGDTRQAFVMPGAGTLALAPNIFDEADLAVPVEGNEPLRLVRSYHSFFNPTGPWGQGWALDLPRLEEAKVPIKRDGNGGSYRIAYEVVTPLNSTSARFSRIGTVPELNNSRLLVPDQTGGFLGLAEGRPDFVTITETPPARQANGNAEVPEKVWHKLIGRDGEIEYFTPDGHLAATQHGGFRTVYETDVNGRLAKIVRMRGKQRVVSIQLSYDSSGRLQSATGQQETGNAKAKATVTYSYNPSGKLVAVRSSEGRTGYQYQYQGPWLTAVSYQGTKKNDKEKTIRQFEYNPHGQLLAVIDAEKTRTEYRVSSDSTGRTLTVTQAGKEANAESQTYDAAFRPLKTQYADGATSSWKYPEGGGTEMKWKSQEGKSLLITESANRLQRTLKFDRRKITANYDTAGRLTTLAENDKPLLSQKWRTDGLLQAARRLSDNSIIVAHA
jgi:YD repeat-containing protein